MISIMRPFSREDLDAIETEMKKIIKEGAEFETFHTIQEKMLLHIMKEKNEPYKVELIEDLPEDSEISFYSQGGLDRPLCRATSDERKGYQSI